MRARSVTLKIRSSCLFGSMQYSTWQNLLSCQLLLVIGDLYVPYRKPGLPKEFQSLLVPGKINHVLCTGNLCSKEMEEYFNSLADEVHIVQGDMDDMKYPEKLIIPIESLTFGLCHGHQIIPIDDANALNALRRDMGVDVLLTGNTKNVGFSPGRAGGLVMHPGSATGAPDVDDFEDPDASFLLIDVRDKKIVAFSYRLSQGELKVEKAVFDSAAS